MKRIITGLLLVGLIILNLVLLEKDPLFFALLISAMAVLGTYEMTKALRGFTALPQGAGTFILAAASALVYSRPFHGRRVFAHGGGDYGGARALHI